MFLKEYDINNKEIKIDFLQNSSKRKFDLEQPI